MSGQPVSRSRFRVFIRRSVAFAAHGSDPFGLVPADGTGRRPRGLRAPAATRVGRDELSQNERKQQMITGRRRTPLAFGYAPVSGTTTGLAGRPLTPGAPVTLAEWERAVLFCRGRVERVLEPGQYRFWRFGCSIRTVDTRPWIISLPT